MPGSQRIAGELADLGCDHRVPHNVLRNGKRAERRSSGLAQGQVRRALNDLAITVEGRAWHRRAGTIIVAWL